LSAKVNPERLSEPDFDRIRHALEPIRGTFNSGYRRFLIGSLISVILATAGVWFLDIIPLILRVVIWLIIVAIGAAISHGRLEKASTEARDLVQPAVLKPFGLDFDGDLSLNRYSTPFDAFNPITVSDKSPFEALGLLPAGEKITHSRRYSRPSPSRLVIQEIEVEQMQLNRLSIVDHFNRNWRSIFIGQGLEAAVNSYDGPPCVLLPRSTPIHSLQLLQRNEYLSETLVRSQQSSELAERFQIWLPERCTGGEFPPSALAEAALEIANLFPGNRVCLALTPNGEGGGSFRMTVDFGRLYRDEAGALNPIQDQVIQEFHRRVFRLVQSHELFAKAAESERSLQTSQPTV
jgi:hypothetical protein